MNNDPPVPSEDSVRFGPFEFSTKRRELRRDGRFIELGQRSLDLLATLLADAGQPVSKARLIKVAWGSRTIEPSNLTVQMATLRRHLGEGGNEPAGAQPLIRTIPGFGYVLTANVSPTRGPAAQQQLPGRPARSWLPEPLTHFIGRDKERRILSRMLAASRLVTLTGMGGVGKTRLVLRLQHELASAYADGITLVDLAPLAESGQVDEAVAAALGAGGGGAAADAALVTILQGRQHLLILDNAEHLSSPVSRLLGQILGRCPLLSVLVTSRESLGLPGEVVFRLAPLDVPPEGGTLTAIEALGYDSVRLLADRAQTLLPGFEIDDETASYAAAVCRRLDGIALAIEMAVPRLEVLSMRQLDERLDDRFGAVSGLRHDVLPRQRTLRAMFDWSWDLLSAPQRRLLQLLAASAAGTTLDSLEALAAADDPAAERAVLDHLNRLTQSSLVTLTIPGHGGADLRYRLLETTRQYALERMPPLERATLSRLYAVQVAIMFERAGLEWPVMSSAAWLDRYGSEADNLRSCLQWAFSEPDEGELALRLTAASFTLWWELPGLPLREARGWYTLALARVGAQTPARVEAWLLLGQGWTDTVNGDVEHYPSVDRAMGLFRTAQDRLGLGVSLWRGASNALLRDHDPPAPALLAEALHVLAQQPAAKWLALCHVLQADLLQAGGALLPALAIYDQAFTTMHALGYGYGLMVCGGNRAYTLFELGRIDEAAQSLRGLQAQVPPGLRHPLLSLLAIMLTAAGHDTEARSVALDGLRGTVTIGMIATLARSIEALALIAARAGDIERAARMFGFVLAQHPIVRTRLGPRRVVFDQLQAALQTGLQPVERARLLAEGAGWTEEEAVAAATV